jgi:hypothetical protein
MCVEITPTICEVARTLVAATKKETNATLLDWNNLYHRKRGELK